MKKRIWLVAALLWMAAAAGQALAANGGDGVAMGREYKRFNTYVSWSK